VTLIARTRKDNTSMSPMLTLPVMFHHSWDPHACDPAGTTGWLSSHPDSDPSDHTVTVAPAALDCLGVAEERTDSEHLTSPAHVEEAHSTTNNKDNRTSFIFVLGVANKELLNAVAVISVLFDRIT
jgi:hypothetical protein